MDDLSPTRSGDLPTTSVVAQQLDKVAELLERGWCQDAYAQNAHGDSVSWGSSDAVCFCFYGALYRAEFPCSTKAEPFLSAAIPSAIDACYGDWNDTPGRTQAEVVAAVRKAAELARMQVVAAINDRGGQSQRDAINLIAGQAEK